MKKLALLIALLFPFASAMPAFAQVAETTAEPILQVATAGDDVHCEDFDTVYYLGENGERYVYPNENIYFSWNDDFEDIVEISCGDLSEIPLGGVVTYQAGSALVKLQTNPTVYAVEDDGTLRAIQSEEQADALYGDDWADQIDDLPDGFFGHYNVGVALTDGEVPDGMIAVDDAGNIFRSHDGVFIEMDELIAEQEEEKLSMRGEDLEELEDSLRVHFEIEIETSTFDEATIALLLSDLMHMLVQIDVPFELEVEVEIEGVEDEHGDEGETDDSGQDSPSDLDDSDEDNDGLVDEWEVEWEIDEEEGDFGGDDGEEDDSEEDNSGSDHSEDSTDDSSDSDGTSDDSADETDSSDDASDDSEDNSGSDDGEDGDSGSGDEDSGSDN